MKKTIGLGCLLAVVLGVLWVSRLEIKPDDFCPEGMSYIPSGSFLMGSSEKERYEKDGESPVRVVSIAEPFCMDKTEVTNAVFETFIKETKYVTEAERIGWSFVLESQIGPETTFARSLERAEWWLQVFGASWVSFHLWSTFKHSFLILFLS